MPIYVYDSACCHFDEQRPIERRDEPAQCSLHERPAHRVLTAQVAVWHPTKTKH